MKKNIILRTLVLFLLLGTISSTYAQTSRNGKRRKAKKTAIVKKGNTASSIVAKKAPVRRVFEGTLDYASYEYHSAAAQKYSFGRAYNGKRSVTYTVSGNKLHIADENTCLHTILDADKGICYYYSEITNQGVSYTYSDYEDLYSQLSDNSRYNNLSWDKDGSITYKGDNLVVRHATLSSAVSGGNTTGSVECWYSKAFKTNSIMKNFLYGLNCPGIVKKCVYDMVTQVPIVGTLRSTVSMELVALREYPVSPSEFDVPDDVNIEPDNINTCKLTVKMLKKHQKAMKKLGLATSKDNAQTLYDIQKEWDFVQEWNASESTCGSMSEFVWGNVGKCAIEVAADVAAAVVASREAYIIYPTPSYLIENATNDTDWNSADMEDTKSDHKLSQAQYELEYQRLEDHAQQVYEALTRYGSRTKTKSTKEDVSGTGGGTSGWRPQYFNSLKKNLRSYQKMMRETRERARRAGYTISQSNYETINVKY